jgi:hypothetical protein
LVCRGAVRIVEEERVGPTPVPATVGLARGDGDHAWQARYEPDISSWVTARLCQAPGRRRQLAGGVERSQSAEVHRLSRRPPRCADDEPEAMFARGCLFPDRPFSQVPSALLKRGWGAKQPPAHDGGVGRMTLQSRHCGT